MLLLSTSDHTLLIHRLRYSFSESPFSGSWKYHQPRLTKNTSLLLRDTNLSYRFVLERRSLSKRALSNLFVVVSLTSMHEHGIAAIERSKLSLRPESSFDRRVQDWIWCMVSSRQLWYYRQPQYAVSGTLSPRASSKGSMIPVICMLLPFSLIHWERINPIEMI